MVVAAVSEEGRSATRHRAFRLQHWQREGRGGRGGGCEQQCETMKPMEMGFDTMRNSHGLARRNGVEVEVGWRGREAETCR